MKVGIITRHAVDNYGSLLQTYATQSVIDNLGYDSEIINYIIEDEKIKNLVNTFVNNSNFASKNAFTKIAYKLLQTPNIYHINKKFDI